MEEDQVELQDVVVIGYGSKSGKKPDQFRIVGQAKDLEKICQRSHDTFDNMPGGAVKGVSGQSKLRVNQVPKQL